MKHPVSKKVLIILSTLALVATTLNFTTSAQAADITTGTLLTDINHEREVYGRPDLVLNNDLMQAAQAKATDMTEVGYFDHTSPYGVTPWDFIHSSGYTYVIAGENLARNFTTTQSAVNAWMNSSEHRANILDTQFTDTGFGISTLTDSRTGFTSVYIVEMFGTTGWHPLAPITTPLISFVKQALGL